MNVQRNVAADFLDRSLRTFSFIWSTQPRGLLAMMGLVVAQVAAARGSFVLVAAVVGEVVMIADGGGSGRAWILVSALAALWVTQVIIAQLLPLTERDLEERVGRRVDHDVSRVSLAMPMAELERSDTQARFLLIRGETTGVPPRSAVSGASGLFNWGLGWVVAAILLAGYSWWAPILPAIGMLVQFRWFNHVWRSNYELARFPVDELRRGSYYLSVSLAPAIAKEVRLFGFGAWATDRYESLWREGLRTVWARRRGLPPEAWVSILLTTSVQGLTITLLARSAVNGGISAAELALYVQSTLALQSTAGTALRNWRLSSTSLRELFELQAGVRTPAVEAGVVSVAGRAGPRSAGQQAPHIAVQDVSFAYPDSPERPVLNDLSLKIEAGRSTAIVGENGVGKTTLIALLAGLYTPDSGVIEFSGPPVGANAPPVAVVFQDFGRYAATLLENVTLTPEKQNVDMAAADEAVRAAGLSDVLERLERGWDTILSPQYEGGTDLSGGEWQRVAIARSLYACRDTESVLVLDEPTANLDVRSEAEVFEKLILARRGKTTLFVSHRFSTVRRADAIHVIAGGRVSESGTHDELLRSDGQYALMFNLQAERFRDAAEQKVRA